MTDATGTGRSNLTEILAGLGGNMPGDWELRRAIEADFKALEAERDALLQALQEFGRDLENVDWPEGRCGPQPSGEEVSEISERIDAFLKSRPNA